MAVNFADIAKKKVAEVEKPPLPPVGTYRFGIKKIPEVRELESPKGSWDVVEFQCQALEALDDVDQEDTYFQKGSVTGIQLRKSFMFDKNDEVKFQQAEYDLTRFCTEHCGIDAETISEMLNGSVNAQFLGTVAWRPDPNNAENHFAEIKRTAPVE